MPNGNQVTNPLAAPLQSLSQLGVQLSQGLQSLGSNLTTSLSQGLQTLAQGMPPLPGLPGAQAQGGLPQLPTPQSLMPANLTQALSQIENVVIPQGLPKPSALMGQMPAPAAEQPAAQQPGVGVITQGSPTTPAVFQTPNGYKPAQTAIAGRRRITALGGY